MNKFIISIVSSVILISCSKGMKDYDATGMFESTEVIVSSEIPGKIEWLNIEEGDTLLPNFNVGCMDTIQLYLSKLQLAKNSSSVRSNMPQIPVQVASLQEQIKKQYFEKSRTENLLRAKAATQKQLDDINSNIQVLEKQLEATLSTLNNNSKSLDDQSSALSVQIAQVDDKLKKCRISSPIRGVILDKYHYTGEVVGSGTPLFKIANIQDIFLRAYFTSEQLSKFKLGDKVKVYADFGNDNIKEYPGTISWISAKSEFTPKNIQTPDERANTVYAVKIAVKNDGLIKLGMYGEVKLK